MVSRYFRRHERLGQADRGFIAEAVYAVLRRRRSLEAYCLGEISPRRLLLAWLGCVQKLNRREFGDVLDAAENQWLAQAKALRLEDFPPALRLDLPDWLYARLLVQLGAEDTEHLALQLNQAAPLDLRVNPLKAERDALLARLRADGIHAVPGDYSPLAMRLADKPALARHPAFLDGSFEVQDEGSQLLGYLVQPRRGEMVADFCAGAGGKTLLLGALMRSQGRLYAFDIAEKRLSNVRPVRIESEHDARLKRLAGKFDRVLVDAPCSGLGTLRRNPDLKWRQHESDVVELAAKQASILTAAAKLVRPGGCLVYATCSLLNEENEAVVEAFLAAHPEFSRLSASEILRSQSIPIRGDDEKGGDLRLWPHRHGTDGFFAAVMARQ